MWLVNVNLTRGIQKNHSRLPPNNSPKHPNGKKTVGFALGHCFLLKKRRISVEHLGEGCGYLDPGKWLERKQPKMLQLLRLRKQGRWMSRIFKPCLLDLEEIGGSFSWWCWWCWCWWWWCWWWWWWCCWCQWWCIVFFVDALQYYWQCSLLFVGSDRFSWNCGIFFGMLTPVWWKVSLDGWFREQLLI